MFFEQVVLQRKGQLGLVWLACHYEKKLTKAQVTETDIASATDKIKNPQAPMALRLSGHLLLGVVRIYCKKVDYLYTDSAEALVKIKMSFRPGVVDMEQSVVNANAITLPETFGDFELLLPGGDIAPDLLPNAEEGLFTLNVAKAVDITIAADVDQMRNQSLSSQLSRQELSQRETVGTEDDLLDPQKAQQSFGYNPWADDGDHLPGNLIGDAGYDDNPLQQAWVPQISDSSSDHGVQQPWLPEHSVSSDSRMDVELTPLDIPDLLATKPAEKAKSAKKYHVDKRCLLTEASMKRTVRDPSSLLRTLSRAPPTKALIQRELNAVQSNPFERASTGLKLSSGLNNALTRGFKSKGELKSPEGTFPSTSSLDDFGRDMSHSLSPDTEQSRKGKGKRSADEMQPPIDYGGDDGFGPGQYLPPLGDDEGMEGYRPPDAGDDIEIEPSDSRPSYESSSRNDLSNVGGSDSSAGAFVVTKRTKNMHSYLEKQFDSKQSDTLSFAELFPKQTKSRNTVAIAFFEILGIKSKRCIDVKQSVAYGDIEVSKTDEFSNLKQTVVQ